MDNKELCKFLRSNVGVSKAAYEAAHLAADRIEDLEAKLEELRQSLLWCSGSADFNEGGVAREGWLKVCDPLLKGESHE